MAGDRGASLAQLEAETAYPLSRAAGDTAAALARTSFRDRLLANLDGAPRG